MQKVRIPSRFMAWLAASAVLSVAALLVSVGPVRVLLFGLALLPLVALGARAALRRAPSIAHAVVIAAALLIFANQLSAAIMVTLVGQILIVVLDILMRARVGRLLALIPRTPTLIRVERLNREELIPASSVHLEERILVQPGEQLPVDGHLITSSARLQLGPHLPIEEHAPGEILIAGSIAHSTLRIEAVAVGKDTTIAALRDIAHRIAKEVPPQLVRMERLLFGAQLLWSVALIGWWFVSDQRALVAWFSLAGLWWLGVLASRLTWVNLLVNRMRHGVLITTWEALRRSRHLRTAVLDKTGTVTDGAPHILQELTAPNISREDLLRVAAALEFGVDHPIARTIKRTVALERLKIPIAESVTLHPSMGLEGLIEEEKFAIGNARLVQQAGLSVPEAFVRKVKLQEAQGATVIYVLSEQMVLGALVLNDVPRPSARLLVEQLRALKFKQIQLLSGDMPLVARATGATIGVAADSVFAQISAERKKMHVQQLPRLEALVVGDPQADKEMLAVSGLGVGFLGWGPALRERSAQVLVRTTDLAQVAKTIKSLRQVELLWWVAPLASAALSALALTLAAVL